MNRTVLIVILACAFGGAYAGAYVGDWSSLQLTDPSVVRVAREAFYLVKTNAKGLPLPELDHIIDHYYDTNGFMLYCEKIRVSNRITNVESTKFSKYIFLSGYNPELGESNGTETVDEYDQFGNLTTRSEVGTDSTLVLRNRFNQRFEGAYRYVINTEYGDERATGKKVLSIYRDNQLVLDIVDNRDNKGALYKYYYYSNRRLTAIKATVKSFLKEEVQYNVVYRYDEKKSSFTEDQYDYHPRPRHTRSVYRYDRNGNLVRLERYTDNVLTGLKTLSYEYRQE